MLGENALIFGLIIIDYMKDFERYDQVTRAKWISIQTTLFER
jgi:hypothetical protein